MKFFKVEVTDLRSGTVYPSIEAAEEALYVSKSGLSACYRHHRDSICGIPVSFKETDRINRPPRPVQCLETGEIFPSVIAGATSIGADVSQICKAIKKGQRVRGYHWRYAQEGEGNENSQNI